MADMKKVRIAAYDYELHLPRNFMHYNIQHFFEKTTISVFAKNFLKKYQPYAYHYNPWLVFFSPFFRVGNITDNLSKYQIRKFWPSIKNQERVKMACVRYVFLFWHLTLSKPCRRFINHNFLSLVLQYYFLFFQVSQV